MDLPIQCQRLKQVREEQGETQASFAVKLDIGSTVTEYERGRTKLSGKLVLRLLSEYNINPLWMYGESEQKYLNPNDRDVVPKMITVDAVGNENILLVNEKAAAGYSDNLGDVEYYESLPVFSMPLPEYRNASFRGFQVEGHSMTPALQPDEWLIAMAVSNVSDVKNGNIYIIVEDSGIRVKKVINNKNDQSLTLISINPDYPTDIVSYDQVKELWQFHSKITQELQLDYPTKKLEELHNDIKDIKAKVMKG